MEQKQNEISARARAAAAAFRCGWTPDDFVSNWRNSAMIYFDEFVKAVRDVRQPVPPAYFESGFCFSENPIFALLDPKMLHCAMEDLCARRRESFALLEREVFTPYVAAWTKLVQALLTRFPAARAEVQAFASKLQAMLGAVRMMATVEGSVRGENFERVHNMYSEMCNAFRTVGVKVAGDSLGNAPAAKGAPTRRHYERYCLPSEVLARLFNVKRETISRWKLAKTSWGRRFRNAKHSIQMMERLSREYTGNRKRPRPRRVQFDEQCHGAVNPEIPRI